MNKKIIAMDVDGVCGDLLSPWIKKYNFDWEDNLSVDEITDWDIHQFVKPQCCSHIYSYIEDPSIYDEVLPIEGAINGVFYLKTLGYRVVFVTHSTEGHSGRKYRWLFDHDFIDMSDDYIECKDKSLLMADYIVDDYIINVNSFRGKSVLFTQPYNKRFLFTPRADNWVEVCRYFYKENNK